MCNALQRAARVGCPIDKVSSLVQTLPDEFVRSAWSSTANTRVRSERVALCTVPVVVNARGGPDLDQSVRQNQQ